MTGAVTDKQVTTVEIKMQWRMRTSKNTMGIVQCHLANLNGSVLL